MRTSYLLLLTLALFTSGCLTGDNTHTFYIEPDGSVTWSVLEKDIHSTSEDWNERREEEEVYISQARISEHPVARALELLAPYSLESRVLRQERPFIVFTSAHFESPELLARTLLDKLYIPGDASVRTNDTLHHFVLSLPRDENEEEDEGEAGALLALVEDLEAYQIVLTQGRFVEAVGFELSRGGTVAVPREIQTDEAGQEPRYLVYSLTWTTEN